LFCFTTHKASPKADLAVNPLESGVRGLIFESCSAL
jgi:hypothetical protein